MDEKYMDFYTKAEIDTMLGGLSFAKISQAEFESITPDANTVYFVYDENGKIVQYFGDAKLTGGTSGLLTNATVSVTGNATFSEIS